MTSIVTRRPTSTVSTYNLGLFGAGVSAHANLADNDDATYVRLFNPADGYWSVKVKFATATITSNQYVSRYRIRMRIGYDNPGLPNVPIVANWRAWLMDGSSNPLAKPDHYTSVFWGTQDPHDIYGAWKQPDYSRYRTWTAADLVTPIVQLAGHTANDNFFPRVMGIWLEHEVRNRPTTSVTAPTGVQTITTQPATVFTYSSVDFTPLTAYQLKVFSAAQYGAVGFDAETSTPTYDSGVVAVTNTVSPLTVRPTEPLPNGVSYRSYVQVRHSGSFNPLYIPKSDWTVSPDYSLNVNPAADPTIISALNAARAQIDVTVQSNNNYLTYQDASFESNAGTWVSDNANTTVARSTTKFSDGVASLRVTSVGTGALKAVSGFYPVIAGQSYVAGGEVVAHSTLRNTQVGIEWWSDIAYISSSLPTAVSEAGTTFPGLQSGVVGVAPIGATRAKLVWHVATATAGEMHYMDKPFLKPGITGSWSRGGLTSEQYVTIWRSVAGSEYEAIVDNVLLDTTTQKYFLEDGTVPNGVTAQYKAQVTSYAPETPEDALSSSVTAPTGVVSITATEWWLRDVQVPEDSIQVSVDQPTLRFVEHEEMAFYKPIGRKNPVVISDVINGFHAPLKLDFLTYDDFLAFKNLRDKQKVLLLKSPLVTAQQWYIRIGPDVNVEVYPTTGGLYCTASMEVTEQDVPSF